jgi:hypothetical protein
MEVGGFAALPPGKEIRHPLNRKLGGPQSWSRLFMRRENYPAPTCKIRLDRPDHSLHANVLWGNVNWLKKYPLFSCYVKVRDAERTITLNMGPCKVDFILLRKDIQNLPEWLRYWSLHGLNPGLCRIWIWLTLFKNSLRSDVNRNRPLLWQQLRTHLLWLDCAHAAADCHFYVLSAIT